MSDPFPVTWEDPSDPELTWEWDDMHTPGVLSPLAADYFRVVIGGITYRFAKFGVPMQILARTINGFAYTAERLEVPESEMPTVLQRALESRQEQARVVREYWDHTVLPLLLETYQWMREQPLERAPLADVAAVWEEAWGRLPQLWGMHFMTNAGSYQSINELADLYESLVEGAHPGEAMALVQGLPNDLQRVQHDLHLLAEKARALPAVAGLIGRDPGTAHGAMADVEGGREFLAALSDFLRAHGHLGQPFDDLLYASWEDDPARLLAEVRKRLEQPGEHPEEVRRRQRAQAEALAARLRERLQERPDDVRRFDEALALALDVGGLTEGHNYWLDRMLHAHLHGFALRVGHRLVEAGVLAAPDHVFFLHEDEIAPAMREPRNLRSLIAQRRAEYQRWRGVRPPRYLGRPPKPPEPGGPANRFEPPPVAQNDQRVLRGIGASPGVVRGRARVTTSPDDFERVRAGDVLVCPSSNPSWVPLFGIIVGLVTNTGGALSHAAVVAREFGVPAVVGVGEATQRLRDGEMVEVDGTAGEVRMLG